MENNDQSIISRYMPFLERVLTPARLLHSVGVMQVLISLAEVYDFDRETAILSGLLHDAAKDLPPEQQAQMIREAGIQIYTACDENYTLYLHGPVGAYFVHRELGINDSSILDAITMHTFYGMGENFHAPLTWCLRFSDILEPNRKWDVRWFREGKERLWECVYQGRLEEAALLHSGWLIRMFESKGFPIHPNITHVCAELTSRLKVDEAFFNVS